MNWDNFVDWLYEAAYWLTWAAIVCCWVFGILRICGVV